VKARADHWQRALLERGWKPEPPDPGAGNRTGIDPLNASPKGNPTTGPPLGVPTPAYNPNLGSRVAMRFLFWNVNQNDKAIPLVAELAAAEDADIVVLAENHQIESDFAAKVEREFNTMIAIATAQPTTKAT
jgi:hypothetical protein